MEKWKDLFFFNTPVASPRLFDAVLRNFHIYFFERRFREHSGAEHWGEGDEIGPRVLGGAGLVVGFSEEEVGEIDSLVPLKLDLEIYLLTKFMDPAHFSH